MAYKIMLIISAIIFLFYGVQLAYKKLALDYCRVLFFTYSSVPDIRRTYLTAYHKSRGILRHIIRSNLSVIDHDFSDDTVYEKGFRNIEKHLPFDEVRLLHQMLRYNGTMSDTVYRYLQQEETYCRKHLLITAISCLRSSLSFFISLSLYYFLQIFCLRTNLHLLPVFLLISPQNLSVCIWAIFMMTVILTMPSVIVRHPTLNCQALLWLICFLDLVQSHNLNEAFTLSSRAASGEFLPHLQHIKYSIEKGPHTVEPLGYVMNYFKDMRFTEDKTVNLSPLILTPYILIFMLVLLQLITDPALVYLWP